MTVQPIQPRRSPDSLADVLERVLDKGVVIAGDIVINVLDIELLSIKLRLFISSAQTAKEMGMDWWSRDPFFTTAADREPIDTDRDSELESLRARVRELEGQVQDSGRELR
ncbi:MAG TPA: gas vesicle protein [Pseudonocardiaceae bacterium]|nr:gas vesicle protein [Pseudonocardiaceae bacterium]